MIKDDNFTYLNNAATSWPKPPEVAAAVGGAITDLPGAANRGGIEDFDVMAAVRDELAALLGANDPCCFALGGGATWALNTAIFGLGLKAGDHVLTTKAEHNSVLRPLHALAQNGVNVHHLDTTDTGHIPHEKWLLTLEEYRPKLAVFTHASNVTGAVNDVVGLVEAAHEHGAIALVDMSQSAGWCPIDLAGWQVDMAAFTGHKYLLGPQGSGALYVREQLELTPTLVGGTGIHSDMDTMPDEMPLHLEAGTGNEPGFCGLLAALKWARANPVNAEYERIHGLLEHLRAGLRDLGAKIVGPDGAATIGPGGAKTSLLGGAATPVLSFTLPNASPHDIGEALLDSYDIIVRTGLHCAPKIFPCLGVDPTEGTVRVSLSRFSGQDDVDALLEAMADISTSLVMN